MTIEEAALFLRVHPKTVGRWIREGVLKLEDMGTEGALLRWLQKRTS